MGPFLLSSEGAMPQWLMDHGGLGEKPRFKYESMADKSRDIDSDHLIGLHRAMHRLWISVPKFGGNDV